MSEREEYSGDFSAYLDGELSESRRRRLDEVLKYDRELAGEMDRLRATRELIHSLPVEQPPRDFAARIVTKAQRKRLLGSLRRPRSYRWITLAAAAVVLVAAGLSVVMMTELPWNQAPDTTDPVGTLALAGDDPDKGNVAEAPGPPKGPGKEAGGYSYRSGKDGPENGKLGEKAFANGRESRMAKVGGLSTSMKSVDPLERTLAIARLAAEKLSKKGAGEAEFVIYTNNLAFAQRDVEDVLVYYGIRPVRATSTPGAVGNRAIHSRNNFFNAKQTTVRQVQYEVFASPQQAGKLKNELKEIREQQEVSQAVTPLPVIAGDIATELAKLPRGRTRTDAAAADEESAGRKTQSKGKYVSEPKPKSGERDDDLDKKTAVASDTDRTRGAKVEGKVIAKGKPTTKDEPSPKALGTKPAEPPKPTATAKPDPTGAAIATQTGKGLPLLPAPTRPVRGTPAARKSQGEAGELEGCADQRPDFGEPPGETSVSKKLQTTPETAPAKALKRRPSTQADLAMRQPVTSQRAKRDELQIRANVTRLLITLNLRGVQPPTSTAEALRKATSQEAAPAAKNKAPKANTNQSH